MQNVRVVHTAEERHRRGWEREDEALCGQLERETKAVIEREELQGVLGRDARRGCGQVHSGKGPRELVRLCPVISPHGILICRRPDSPSM
jgi:hypothetical protein